MPDAAVRDIAAAERPQPTHRLGLEPAIGELLDPMARLDGDADEVQRFAFDAVLVASAPAPAERLFFA